MTKKRYPKQCRGCKKGVKKQEIKRAYIGGQKLFLCNDCLTNNEGSIVDYVKEDHARIKCLIDPANYIGLH